jgi:hypothetical protein
MIMYIKFTVFSNVMPHRLAVRYKGIGGTLISVCTVDDISAWKAETACRSEYFISSTNLHVHTSRKTDGKTSNEQRSVAGC